MRERGRGIGATYINARNVSNVFGNCFTPKAKFTGIWVYIHRYSAEYIMFTGSRANTAQILLTFVHYLRRWIGVYAAISFAFFCFLCLAWTSNTNRVLFHISPCFRFYRLIGILCCCRLFVKCMQENVNVFFALFSLSPLSHSILFVSTIAICDLDFCHSNSILIICIIRLELELLQFLLLFFAVLLWWMSNWPVMTILFSSSLIYLRKAVYEHAFCYLANDLCDTVEPTNKTNPLTL